MKSKEESKTPPLLKLTVTPRHYDVLLGCRQLQPLMAKVEHKETIPQYRGRDGPVELSSDPMVHRFLDTKESISLRNSMRSLFGNKLYEFRISTALNMSSSAGGIVNSTLSNSTIASNADFVALSGVFNEFFVKRFDVTWHPVSRYQYPLTGTSAASVSSLPIGKADLQHGAVAYTSLSSMAENFSFRYHSTGDPFSDSWLNTERVSDKTLASETAPVQSWCNVNNVSSYQGTLQFLSQSAPPGLPASQVLGTFIVHWYVVFRVRT